MISDEREKVLIYEPETFAIRGALFEVYKRLGPGYLEAVYQEALEIELKKRNVPFEAQKDLPVFYDGVELKQKYRADIVCYDKVILELKAVRELVPEHQAQLQNYLKISGMKLGMLVNFGHYPGIQIVRIAN